MEEKEYKTRLRSLHIVLALSLIGNGFNALGYALMSLSPMRNFARASMDLMPEVMQETYELMLSIPWSFYAVSAIMFAMAFAGAVLMWRLRGMGFHYYTIAKMVLIGLPLLFLGRQYLNIGDVMMSLLFIAFYYVTLRSLGAFKNKDNKDSDNTEQNALDKTEDNNEVTE